MDSKHSLFTAASILMGILFLGCAPKPAEKPVSAPRATPRPPEGVSRATATPETAAAGQEESPTPSPADTPLPTWTHTDVENTMVPPLSMVRLPGRELEIGKYEITREQWKHVMGSDPSSRKGEEGLPVQNVSWDDAHEFVERLNAMKAGGTYRLPTREEWEYAYRAGTTSAYYFGDSPYVLAAHGWYIGNSGNRVRPVGLKNPNPWGIYDMAGNMWEWVEEVAECYLEQPRQAGVECRALMGGSWGAPHDRCTATFVLGAPPQSKSGDFGFRLVRVPEGE